MQTTYYWLTLTVHQLWPSLSRLTTTLVHYLWLLLDMILIYHLSGAKSPFFIQTRCCLDSGCHSLATGVYHTVFNIIFDSFISANDGKGGRGRRLIGDDEERVDGSFIACGTIDGLFAALHNGRLLTYRIVWLKFLNLAFAGNFLVFKLKNF